MLLIEALSLHYLPSQPNDSKTFKSYQPLHVCAQQHIGKERCQALQPNTKASDSL